MTKLQNALQLVGGGKMGQALLAGLVKADWASISSDVTSDSPSFELIVVETNKKQREAISQKFPGVTVVDTPRPNVDTIVAVKPHLVVEVCSQLEAPCRLMSIAAGITIEAIQTTVGESVAVLRVMPNTPAIVGEGASAIAAGPSASDADVSWATSILSSVGQVVIVAEQQIDAVTGLSGSGPAYIFAVAEALTEAGVKVGLDQLVAEKLAFQTLYGAAKLLTESDSSPAELRAQVTTPGGTTAAGLAVLEKHNLQQVFASAVAAAVDRSVELGTVES